jgi:hypothetical protein
VADGVNWCLRQSAEKFHVYPFPLFETGLFTNFCTSATAKTSSSKHAKGSGTRCKPQRRFRAASLFSPCPIPLIGDDALYIIQEDLDWLEDAVHAGVC